jgi:sialate O-acetylesterase
MVSMKQVKSMVCLVFISLVAQLSAEVKLAKILGDNMILQRGKAIAIWGDADAGEKIEVHFAGEKVLTKADTQGHWKVTLKAQRANAKAQEMKINKLTLKNILIGDIWLGSGQSNMAWPLMRTEKSKEAIVAARHPNIRLFNVQKTNTWNECSPQTVPEFSGVLYYFGRKLHQELGIPIGLIKSAVGGSRIEPWLAPKGNLYKQFIASLRHFKIKGFTWYQGETNVIVKTGLAYYDLQKELIEGWRKEWDDRELPFYYVQVGPCDHKKYVGQLPALWEAQAKALSISKTGMVVITDIVGNAKNIHPGNKLDVGERLARWALAKDYGKSLVYSGPMYKSMKISGSTIVISFEHTTGGLVSRDGKELNEFQIAGDDGQYVTAKAIIKGDTVIVESLEVKAPKNVRFGWHKLANPNLMNKAKLPAAPFHTKNWQGVTVK